MGNLVDSRRLFPPREGEATLLVYGSCPNCGWWCAMHEGAHWPTCPECQTPGEHLVPIRGESFDDPPRPPGHPRGFVAFLMGEGDAVKAIGAGAALLDPSGRTTVDGVE